MGLFSRRSRSTTTAASPARASGNGEQAVALAPEDAKVEALTQQLGRDYLAAARGNQRGWLSSRFWSDKLMDWAMKDENFKVQLFRFVDAFPMLKSAEEIHDHLTDYLSQPGVTPPPGRGLGL